MMPIRKTVTLRNQALLKSSHGSLVGLLVGIDNYKKESGFDPLKTCSNDAIYMKDTLIRTTQLNADEYGVKTLTSLNKETIPSRGEIIAAVMKLAEVAESEDRLLFYFSGHGHKLSQDKGLEEFYLVPQDAYDSEKLECLIQFQEILEIIKNSKAKQKLIILDACLSGPIMSTKLTAAKYSPTFLADYLRGTKGVAIISSSSGDEASHTKSPSPKLSLFTYYLIKALEGSKDALDDTNMLTIQSLFEYVSTEVQRSAKSYQKVQTPNIHIEANNSIVLGNFGINPIFSDENNLGTFPISSLIFSESRGSLQVKDILTYIKFYNYSEEYYQKTVNKNLGDYLSDEFDNITADLLNTFKYPFNSIDRDGNSIAFPGGTYTVVYIAENKKKGKRKDSIVLENSWFEKPQDILSLLNLFNMSPQGVTFVLKKTYKSDGFIQFFTTQGWTLVSYGNKVEMTKGLYRISIEDTAITLNGIKPNDIFGDNGSKEKRSLTFQALSLLTERKD